MRFLFFLLLLAAAGFAGWIAGSLHPAPASILAPIEQFLTGAETVSDEGETDELETFGTPAETPEPEIETPAAPVSTSDSSSGEDSLDQYRTWIAEARAAHPYPESEEKMFDVMMCESGGNATIVNPAGPYTGLFQYATGTWNGDWNQYREGGILDARSQIFATALAWNLNMQSQWGCYARSH